MYFFDANKREMKWTNQNNYEINENTLLLQREINKNTLLLQREIKEKSDEISHLRSALDQQNKTIKIQEEKLFEKMNNDSLSSFQRESEAKIQELQKKFSQNSELVKNQAKELDRKSKEIKVQEEKLLEYEKMYNDLLSLNQIKSEATIKELLAKDEKIQTLQSDIIEKSELLQKKTSEILHLNSELDKKNKDIKVQEIKISELSLREKIKMKELQTKDRNYQEKFADLTKQLSSYEFQIDSNTKKLIEFERSQNCLLLENSQLKKEKEEVQEAYELLMKEKNEKIIQSRVQDQKEKEEDFSERNELSEFYDVIVDVKSLKQLTDGWEIKLSEKGKKQLEKTSFSCVVGVIGNFNKGKSYILGLLSKLDFEHGYSIQTKGISAKYLNLEKESESEDQEFITLLDSAGFETPLKNFFEGKNLVEKNEYLEIARDRQLTELFLQKFILDKSNILLIVVGILTYSDQKLLNRLRIYVKQSNLS